MPNTSEHWQIPHVLDVVIRERPARVLDVGAGFGKYGALVREYGGVVRVDAVDAVQPELDVYDTVTVGDVREVDWEPGLYDMALLLDVIEHVDKAEGHALLASLARSAGLVLVATPLGFRRQENPELPYETHRSGWWPWDFSGYTVHQLSIYPGHFTRHLRLPRHWQMLALVSK